MVQVIHSFNRIQAKKKKRNPVSCMLGNKTGSYAYFNTAPESRYQGFFCFDDGKMYRAVEHIELLKAKPVSTVHNRFHAIERKRGPVMEQFFMPLNCNSLVYELSKKEKIIVYLDVKESYDNREWGRFYEIQEEEDCVVVTFTKKTDGREDSSHDEEECRLYISIAHDGSFKKLDEWVERSYTLDKQRNSFPFTRYAYKALALEGSAFVFSVSKKKEQAIKECRRVFREKEKLKKEKEGHIYRLIDRTFLSRIKDSEKKLAYVASVTSLDSLIVRTKQGTSILAGLPWFYQIWSRDELISLKALLLLKKGKAVKEILERYLKSIDNGTRTNSQSDMKAADVVGWMFKRVDQYYKKRKDLKFSKRTLKAAGNAASTHADGFALNSAKETWMDSISREGIRIEMQALYLCMYKFMFKLTKQKKYLVLEKALQEKTREQFWNGNYLCDGINDKTIRPNLFLAFYLYPSLLSTDEWKTCFHTALRRLWLPYGGLATIDKKDTLFYQHHTGENAASYHNGDSWFWINNLAALCLHDLDKKEFNKYVNKILEAIVSEILWSGMIGHHAELSSASSLKSEGCLQQAWSAALFIELVQGLYGKR